MLKLINTAGNGPLTTPTHPLHPPQSFSPSRFPFWKVWSTQRSMLVHQSRRKHLLLPIKLKIGIKEYSSTMERTREICLQNLNLLVFSSLGFLKTHLLPKRAMLTALTQWLTGIGAFTLSYDPRGNLRTTELGLGPFIGMNYCGKSKASNNKRLTTTVRLWQQSQRRLWKRGVWLV